MFRIVVTEKLKNVMINANQNEFDKIRTQKYNTLWKDGLYVSVNQYSMESEPIGNFSMVEYIIKEIRKISNLDVNCEQIIEFKPYR